MPKRTTLQLLAGTSNKMNKGNFTSFGKKYLPLTDEVNYLSQNNNTEEIKFFLSNGNLAGNSYTKLDSNNRNINKKHLVNEIGINWNTVISNYPTTINAAVYNIVYGNEIWVISGNSGIRTSTDNAITWNTVPIGALTINSLAYGNGIWMVGLSDSTLRVSTDQTATWNTISPGVFGNIYGIAYGNGLWAISGGVFGVSTFYKYSTDNGVTWNTSSFTNAGAPIYHMIYADQKFVGVGTSGTIVVSTDAQNWSKKTNSYTTNFNKIIYANGTWLASGSNASFATSTDATTWQITTSPSAGKIEYGDGIWVLSTGLTIYTSKNLINWTTQISNFTTQAFEVAYGNGTFVASGSSGQMRISRKSALVSGTFNSVNLVGITKK